MSELARLSYSHGTEVMIAVLEGEVDVTNTEAVANELLGALPPGGVSVILDLSPTTYVDSAGIRMLFDLASKLRARGRELRLVVPDEAVIRRALVLTQVDAAAPIHATVEEASVALSAPV